MWGNTENESSTTSRNRCLLFCLLFMFRMDAYLFIAYEYGFMKKWKIHHITSQRGTPVQHSTREILINSSFVVIHHLLHHIVLSFCGLPFFFLLNNLKIQFGSWKQTTHVKTLTKCAVHIKNIFERRKRFVDAKKKFEKKKIESEVTQINFKWSHRFLSYDVLYRVYIS